MAANSIYKPVTVPVDDDDEDELPYPSRWGSRPKAQVIEMPIFKKPRFFTQRRVLYFLLISVALTFVIAAPILGCSIAGCGRSEEKELVVEVDIPGETHAVIQKTTEIESDAAPRYEFRKDELLDNDDILPNPNSANPPADRDSEAWKKVMDFIKENEKKVEKTIKEKFIEEKEEEINIDSNQGQQPVDISKPQPYIGKAEVIVKTTFDDEEDEAFVGSGDHAGDKSGALVDRKPAIENALNRDWRTNEDQWKKPENYVEAPRRYWDERTQRWLALESKDSKDKDIYNKNEYDMKARKGPKYFQDEYSDEYSDESYSEEDYSDEDYSDEDYSDEDYSDEDYSDEDYSDESSEEDYSDEDYSDEDYSDEDYSDEDYSDEDYSDEDYSDEDYSDEDYSDEDYSDEDYSDEDYSDEDYSDEDYSNEKKDKSDYSVEYSDEDSDYYDDYSDEYPDEELQKAVRKSSVNEQDGDAKSYLVKEVDEIRKKQELIQFRKEQALAEYYTRKEAEELERQHGSKVDKPTSYNGRGDYKEESDYFKAAGSQRKTPMKEIVDDLKAGAEMEGLEARVVQRRKSKGRKTKGRKRKPTSYF